MSDFDVLGKGSTALVTGASRGIGPLIAAQIARRLGLSIHTVERHVANLYRKIGARVGDPRRDQRADAAGSAGDQGGAALA